VSNLRADSGAKLRLRFSEERDTVDELVQKTRSAHADRAARFGLCPVITGDR
jgi:hypothetical protein